MAGAPGKCAAATMLLTSGRRRQTLHSHTHTCTHTDKQTHLQQLALTYALITLLRMQPTQTHTSKCLQRHSAAPATSTRVQAYEMHAMRNASTHAMPCPASLQGHAARLQLHWARHLLPAALGCSGATTSPPSFPTPQ